MPYVQFMGGPLHGTEGYKQDIVMQHRHTFENTKHKDDPTDWQNPSPIAESPLKTAIYNYTPCRDGEKMYYYYVFQEIVDGW